MKLFSTLLITLLAHTAISSAPEYKYCWSGEHGRPVSASVSTQGSKTWATGVFTDNLKTTAHYVDITDRKNPVPIGTQSIEGKGVAFAQSNVVIGGQQFTAVVSLTSDKLIFNLLGGVASMNSPIKVDVTYKSMSDHIGIKIISVGNSQYAYINAGKEIGIVIIQISSAWNMKYAGVVKVPYGFQDLGYAKINGTPMIIAGDIYGSDGGITMLDVSNPIQPVNIFDLGELSHRGMTVAEVGGKPYLFLTDCHIYAQINSTKCAHTVCGFPILEDMINCTPDDVIEFSDFSTTVEGDVIFSVAENKAGSSYLFSSDVNTVPSFWADISDLDNPKNGADSSLPSSSARWSRDSTINNINGLELLGAGEGCIYLWKMEDSNTFLE